MIGLAARAIGILAAIGEDPERDGLKDTPARVARMYAETCAGLHEDPSRHLKVTFDADHDEMILVREIPFYSMCEHHLVPFFGHAHVAYIPSGGKITGLSKLARLVDVYAKRPQVQERLVERIKEEKLRDAATGIFERVQRTAVVKNVYNDPELSKTMPGVVATVNGERITMQELGNECLLRHGEEVLEGEISRTLFAARSACSSA